MLCSPMCRVHGTDDLWVTTGPGMKFWIPMAARVTMEVMDVDNNTIGRSAGSFTGVGLDDGVVDRVDYIGGPGNGPRFDLIVKREGRILGNRQYGVFTNVDLFEGDCIGEVTGVVETRGRRGPYCFGTRDFNVDASVCGNEFRFMNHYQGLSVDGDANCMFVAPLTKLGLYVGRVLVFPTRDITAGEQLLVRYGTDGVETGQETSAEDPVEWVETGVIV